MSDSSMHRTGHLAPAKLKRTRTKRPADSVERVYKAVKELAVQYRFPPGTRINEVTLARRLGVSRTPIREALNRLVRDGFMRFVPNRGFFARELTSEFVRDLYELRAAIEVAAVRLACERGGTDEIAELRRAWDAAVSRFPARRLDRMADADEAFHIGIAKLSDNREIVAALEALNAQIWFFRRVDQDSEVRRQATYREHAEILDCLAGRDVRRAVRLMESHVVLSKENALSVTQKVVARLPRRADDAAAEPRVSSATAATAPSTARSRRRPPSAAERR